MLKKKDHNYTALEIAKEITSRLAKLYPEKKISITAIQKLLYYSQAWHLHFNKKPLFKEDFEAWDMGPVIPYVWTKFKHEIHLTKKPILVEYIASNLLDAICEVYGDIDREEISDMTHSEDPWLKSKQKGRSIKITQSSIRKYFKKIYNGENLNDYHKSFLDIMTTKSKTGLTPARIIDHWVEMKPKEALDLPEKAMTA